MLFMPKIHAEGGKIGLVSLGYTLQEPSTVAPQATSSENKAGCFLCPRSMDQKVKTMCSTCKKTYLSYIFK